jgi:hypothetical protein
MRRFENLKQPSRGRHSKVANLLSLGPSIASIVIIYLRRDKLNSSKTFQPFQQWEIFGMKGGMIIITSQQWEIM